MMPARMYDLTAMKAPVEQPVLCRDLVSCQDFSPEETKSMFELTHIIKHRPADFRGALAGKQLAGGDTLHPSRPQLCDRIWQATFSVAGGARTSPLPYRNEMSVLLPRADLFRSRSRAGA